MEDNPEYDSITREEYDGLLQRLKSGEIEKSKLARELKTVKKNIDIMKQNMDSQTVLNKFITDEKQKQEMYVRLLLESCPDPMFIFDENMKFLLGTKSTTSIIGIEDVSILQGRELDNIVARYHPPVLTEELTALIRDVILNQGKGDAERTIEVTAGKYKFEVNIQPFQKDNNEFAGALILMHDITEIIRSKDIAEQASMAKSEFLSRMSHEMRTPMNAIIGMTGIAKKSSDPEKKEYCLDRIESASSHLLGVINDILDMAKIEANKFELSYYAFAFDKMLANIINVINFRAEEKQQSIIINTDEDIPEFIIGDELRLTQVITNLMTNAIKFTPDGGTITLCAKNVPAALGKPSIQVEIIDTGIGISHEQQTRLFVSFEQADGGTARKYGGTGLGLAISKKIVELMGGSIWVESDLGCGSKFIFTIQYEQGDAQQQAMPGTCNDSSGGPDSGDEAAHDYRNRIVLVAEDVDINREIISAVLEESGISIDFAENGLEAVSMYRDQPGRYDLILMDIQMPEMDGYEATRQIRALECGDDSNVPIIAMTANVFKEDIEHCLAVGMDDHLGKPIDRSDLFCKMDRFLNI